QRPRVRDPPARGPRAAQGRPERRGRVGVREGDAGRGRTPADSRPRAARTRAPAGPRARPRGGEGAAGRGQGRSRARRGPLPARHAVPAARPRHARRGHVPARARDRSRASRLARRAGHARRGPRPRPGAASRASRLSYPYPMSIKSDRWIRRMAQEHRMIEPFPDRQVREGVISYGVSSYGYDVRIADEFKIFTNINSTIVDPKHFDPRSFVDFKGEVCIIPPNSFALARTVEY